MQSFSLKMVEKDWKKPECGPKTFSTCVCSCTMVGHDVKKRGDFWVLGGGGGVGEAMENEERIPCLLPPPGGGGGGGGDMHSKKQKSFFFLGL
jgi:hypothetical protein